MKAIKEILFLIPYSAMWFFAVLFYNFLNNEGLRIDYGIAYGSAAKILCILLAVLIFFSFIIIKVLHKQAPDWIRYIVAFTLSIILFASIILIDKYTSENMQFSKTIWENHPHTRMFFYEKIKENFDIYTYSEQDIINLLGEPDEFDNNMFTYNDGNGNAIYIKFKENIAYDMYMIG